mgnify:FL=1
MQCDACRRSHLACYREKVGSTLGPCARCTSKGIPCVDDLTTGRKRGARLLSSTATAASRESATTSGAAAGQPTTRKKLNPTRYAIDLLSDGQGKAVEGGLQLGGRMDDHLDERGVPAWSNASKGQQGHRDSGADQKKPFSSSRTRLFSDVDQAGSTSNATHPLQLFNPSVSHPHRRELAAMSLDSASGKPEDRIKLPPIHSLMNMEGQSGSSPAAMPQPLFWPMTHWPSSTAAPPAPSQTTASASPSQPQWWFQVPDGCGPWGGVLTGTQQYPTVSSTHLPLSPWLPPGAMVHPSLLMTSTPPWNGQPRAPANSHPGLSFSAHGVSGSPP